MVEGGRREGGRRSEEYRGRREEEGGRREEEVREEDGGDVLEFLFFSILDAGRKKEGAGLNKSFEVYFLIRLKKRKKRVYFYSNGVIHV